MFHFRDHSGRTEKQHAPRVAANVLQLAIPSLCLNAETTELTRRPDVKKRNQTLGEN